MNRNSTSISKRISIISPVYNAENYIERFLLAIKMQTFKSFQWILIDDGSTDETLQIIQKFKYENLDLDIKVLTKKNGGVSSARNLGLKYVTGKYLTFADSDDIPEPVWLENIAKELDSNPKAELFITNAKKVKPNKEFIREVYSTFKLAQTGTFSYLASGLLSMQVNGYLFTIVSKVSLWENILFDENVQFLEDELVLLTLLIKRPKATFTYLNNSDYLYVQNPNSYLHTMTHDKRLNSLSAVHKMEDEMKHQGVLNQYNSELSKRKASIYFSLAKLAVAEQMHGEFKTYLSKYKYYEKSAVKSNHLAQRIFDSTKYILSYTNSEYLFRLLAMRNEKIVAKDSLKEGTKG